jgi:hypothetical protein
MPKLLRVQEAQAIIVHPAINKGYKIKNGGCGMVTAMTTAHPTLINQAVNSATNLMGQLR